MQKHSGVQIDENTRKVKLVHNMRSDRETRQKHRRKENQEKTERSDKDNIHTHTRDRKYQNNKKKQDRDRKAQPVALRLSSKLLSWSEGKLFNSSKDFLNSVESHRQVTR